ncbi:MAG: PEGA domain-containing protein [Deltaproteobacteria bacterium]|nr:PEGA domain-containing protein [Deltaproteobacteria bacterium]
MRAAVVLALVALLAAPVAADPTPRKDPSQAEVLFNAGERAYRNAEFALASKFFEQAYEQLPAPEIAFSAAQAYRLAYQKDQKPEYVRRAIELYDLYQKQVQKGPQVADALAHLGRLRTEWRDIVVAGKATDDRVRVEKSQISVILPAAVDGAKVRIDGKAVPALEYVDVEPGEHTIEVEAPGYSPFTRKVTVPKNNSLPLPAELVPRPAQIKVESEGGIQIAVDGRVVASREGVIEVPFGKRYITITRRGRRPFAREIVLKPGATQILEAELRPTDQRRVARVVLIGSAALLGITALTTTLALVADARASERAAGGIHDQAEVDDYTTWKDRRDAARTTTYVLGTATVFAAVTALGLYVFDNPQAEATVPIAPDKREDTRFTPMAFGSAGYGVGVTGAW